MYLDANNEEEPVSTFSFKEVLGFISIVLLLLYFLFPKTELDNLLNKDKKENTNLSIEYLTSMLSHHPENIFLEKKLMEKYELNGEPEKALDFTQDLFTKIQDKKELKKLYKREYILLKQIYFKDGKTGTSKQLLELQEKLQKLNVLATETEDYQFLLQESTSMNFQQLRYDVLKIMLKESKGEEHNKLKKEAFYLAVSLNYDEEAYAYLSSLLNNLKTDLFFQDEALRFLIKYKKTQEAEKLVLHLIQHDEEHSKRLEHFKMGFYMLIQDKKNNKAKVKNLIELYQLHASLKSNDLYLLSNALLQINEDKKAADFMYESFEKKPKLFDENTSKEAIRILSYNQQLKRALKISNSTYKKYPSVQNLDSSIELSTWVSRIDKAIALNIEGYRKFDNPKYERYLLEKTSFNHAYKIRGEIYKTKIKDGNFTMVSELGNYFEYTGEIEKAQKYFNKLVKKYPKKSIYEEAIRFNHYNNNYGKMEKLYTFYRKKFGNNKKIHKKMIDEALAQKKLNSAYQFSKELKILDPHSKQETKVKEGVYATHHTLNDSNLKLKQIAWIKKDYNYLHQLLWEEEPLFTQNKNDYEILIKLEKNLLEKPKLQYLYTSAWNTTNNSQYLQDLLSLQLKLNKYQEFNKIIRSLNPSNRALLEETPSYQLLLANYYQNTSNKSQAYQSFQAALHLAPKDSRIHSDYIWFLIENYYEKELNNEVTLLQKSTKLQQKLAFPSVLAALKINKGDLALKWLKPLLKKHKEQLEYQVVYSDILAFQGKDNAATKIRSKLFRQLHKQLKSSPELQKDKKNVSLYLELLIYYNKLSFSKKNLYLKKFKSLFTDEEYLKIVNSLITKHKITTLLDLGKNDHAQGLLFKAMQDNQSNQEFTQRYWELINTEFSRNNFTLLSEQISKEIKLQSMRFSHNHTINEYFNLGLKFSQNKFLETNKETKTDNIIALSLANRKSNFLWDVTIGKAFEEQDYSHASFMLKYQFTKLSVNLNLQHNKTTQLSPNLEVNGLEDNFGFALDYELNPYNQFNLNYKKSKYQFKNGHVIGEGEQLKLSNTYTARLGYPDVSFYNYLNIHHLDFDNEDDGLRSFTEIGSELNLGTNSKNNLTKSWKPYMSLGLALNDHREVGTSISLGASGMVYQADKLDVSLQYTKGINNISEERYGLFVEYNY